MKRADKWVLLLFMAAIVWIGVKTDAFDEIARAQCAGVNNATSIR